MENQKLSYSRGAEIQPSANGVESETEILRYLQKANKKIAPT